MFLKKIWVAIFLLIFGFFLQTNVLALGSDLPKTTINPDKYLFYSFKRLFEKTIIYTKFSKQAKVAYYQELVQLRLAELKYLVENKLVSEIEQATNRFSYQVGILCDFISSNKTELIDKKQKNTELLVDYKGLLSNLRDYFPANSSYWMLIQHDINSIEINLEKLKN